MKKTRIGLILGAVVYFLAGMLEWTVLPWHDSVIKRLPEEILIRDTLKVVIPESGFYAFPSDKKDDGQKMSRTEFTEHFASGPAGIVLFQTAGKNAMGPKNILIGLITAFVVSGFCLWMLSLCSTVVTTYFSRVSLVVMLGFFQWFASHIPYWNWFYFPLPYVLVIAFDTLLSFTLLGLVLAKFGPDQ